MRGLRGVALFWFAMFLAYPGNVFGETVDEKAAAEVIQVLKTFETGINTRDVDLCMSVLHPTASIQAGAAKKKLMYSWEAYKEHLVVWVTGIKDFEHYNFRKITMEGDKASLVCDVNLMALSQNRQWKMRTALDIYHEFVRDGGKWYMSKRTYE